MCSPWISGDGRSFTCGVEIIAFPSARYSPSFHPWHCQTAGVLNTNVERLVLSSQSEYGYRLATICSLYGGILSGNSEGLKPPSNTRPAVDLQHFTKFARFLFVRGAMFSSQIVATVNT